MECSQLFEEQVIVTVERGHGGGGGDPGGYKFMS